MKEQEKIKISWDEVDRVGGVDQASAKTTSSEQKSPLPKKALAWSWMLGGAGIILLILVVVALTRGKESHGKAPSQTVEAWIAQERPKWAIEISESPTVRKYIEDVHPFVTYKRAAISEMRAVTVDGSNQAGRSGDNVSEVEILVTFYWQGPVTKDGFTEVRFNYDYQGRQLKAKRFSRSNATINLETVDWFNVGVALGALLL